MGTWAIEIREDFAWSEREIEAARAAGWERVIQFPNVLDVTRPWTFSGKVVVRMYLIHPASVVSVGPGVRYSTWMTVDRNNGRVEYDRHGRAYDCRGARMAYLLGSQADVDPLTIPLDRLRWHEDSPDTPAAYREAVCS